MKLKTKFIYLLIFLTNTNLFGQKNNEIYTIERKLMLGNKKALVEIALYFDSKKALTEYLGYHTIYTTESEVAKRIVNENCIFTEAEIIVSDKTTSKEFLTFLNQNFNQISFSIYAQAFLLSPLEKRNVKFEIREISKNKREELNQKSDSLLDLKWVKSNKINVLIKEKNPKALLLISSELYKVRYRLNKSFYGQLEFIDLIRLLTGTEIATENVKNQLTWFIENEFYPNAYLNLLIYFSNNYSNYKWNDEKSIFENQTFSVNQLTLEELLFEQLTNKNDSIAKDAFKQLTKCKIEKVIKIADQYEKSGIKTNYVIPVFPYRFLKELVLLTDYCNQSNIDYEGSDELYDDIKLLESKLSFLERRKLENKLIENLTLEQITAFEYLSLLNQKSWELTYSAGRILDVFYSKNWNNLLNNDSHLKLYIKKSLLFKRLGIIGICNNYTIKFQNSDNLIIDKLNSLDKSDLDIEKQIDNIIKVCSVKTKKPNIIKKEFDGNKDFLVTNLDVQFSKIKKESIEKYEDEVTEILSKINYNQIGKALELIEDIKFNSVWKDKYSFIERDFGFYWLQNFKDKNERTEFINAYNKYSEYDLYSYYLSQSGIEYLNEDNSFDYDKIFELLKFDVVVAFVGGGGGKRDNEVYALIKLLEIKHKTTLGYPKKVCNSNGTYACYSDDRASEWMQFFIENNLLKLKHNEPISFNQE